MVVIIACLDREEMEHVLHPPWGVDSVPKVHELINRRRRGGNTGGMRHRRQEMHVILDRGKGEDLMDVRPSFGLHREEASNESLKLGGGGGGQRIPLASYDLLAELRHVPGLKRRVQRDELIQKATNRPHIRLGVVWFLFPDLRGDVVRRADLINSKHLSRPEDLANTKIPNLQTTFPVDEDVRRFQVTVEDPFLVGVFHPNEQLEKKTPNSTLGESRLSRGMFFHLAVQVSVCSVVGHNVELPRGEHWEP